MPPTRLIPGAAAATPRPTGRAGPEDPAPARSVPARPRGGRRATGPAATTIANHAEREASTPPRAGPARTRRQPQTRSDPSKNPTTTMTAAGSSPAGPSRTRDGSAGRSSRTRMPPPTGARTGRGGRLLRGGCGGVPRPPGPPGEEDHRFLQEPVPHAGLPEPRPQPPDPGALLRGHGISAETGAPPRHPATQFPTVCATRPYDPATPATGPDPRTIPRTTRPPNPAPHPGTDTTQPHPTTTPPTARKTPNTPPHQLSRPCEPVHHSDQQLASRHDLPRLRRYRSHGWAIRALTSLIACA